jgi:hypothetical protein
LLDIGVGDERNGGKVVDSQFFWRSKNLRRCESTKRKFDKRRAGDSLPQIKLYVIPFWIKPTFCDPLFLTKIPFKSFINSLTWHSPSQALLSVAYH